MPKNNTIHSILIPGSGPIGIGQACEFYYPGVQAGKVMRREGYRIVLVNSNPATIMTDPDLADATYVEPLTVEIVEKIIELERPDALLPTVGGQTALNLAMELDKAGVLAKYGVQMLGARPRTIQMAEDRSKFRDAMIAHGIHVPPSHFVYTLAEAWDAIADIGYPALVRASFTLGGAGGGIINGPCGLERVVAHG